jgi:hypothetical protein
MATTTNYSWATPDDTALVKDGASAIRTLGSSVDTTTKNLNPSTTLGDIEYRSSTSNTNTRLGIGTTGQVLAVSGGVPAWTTSSSGGITLISETVASGLSSLSLSSIPSTYKDLLLTWHGIFPSATATSGFAIRLNNNSTAATYQGALMTSSGSSTTNNRFSATDISNATVIGSAPFGWYLNTASADLQKNAAGSLIIYNYASATKFKLYESQFYHTDQNGTNYHWKVIGNFCDTTAISSIDVFRDAGTATFSNATNTSIRLYGLS